MSEENRIRDAADAVKGIVQAIPVYQDTLQPAAKQVGTALETVSKTIHIALAPISALVWGYDQIKTLVSTRVAEKLKDVPSERIVSPSPQLAGPLLEALRYTGHDEQLRELYATLLATSLDFETQRDAHPAFVDIIKSMSPDEARIIRFFSSTRTEEHLIDVCGHVKNRVDYVVVVRNFTRIADDAKCEYKNMTPEYLENLCRLGLLTIDKEPWKCGMYGSHNRQFSSLEDDASLSQAKETIEAADQELEFHRKLISLTSFGLQFCNACVEKSN